MFAGFPGRTGFPGGTGATGGTGFAGAPANKRRKRQAGCPGQSAAGRDSVTNRRIGLSAAIGVHDIRTKLHLYHLMSFVAFQPSVF